MRHETYISSNLEIVGGFIYSVAFHAVLYLWGDLLMKIQPGRSLYVLQGMALVSILLGTIVSGSYVISFNRIYNGPIINTISDILPFVVFPIQSLLAVIFIISGKFSRY